MTKKKALNFDLTVQSLTVLPHSPLIEMTVISQIISKPDLYNIGLKFLRPKNLFYDDRNDLIWQQMNRMVNSGIAITLIGLDSHFRAANKKNIAIYLYEIINNLDFLSKFIPNCLILNEYWIRRTIFKFGFYVNQNALKEDVEALDLLGESSDILGKLFLHIAGMKEKTLLDGVNELSAEIQSMQETKGSSLGVQSSIFGINSVIKGFRKGNLIIIAASTGEGKTTLAIQDTKFLIDQGKPVGYISLEMTTSELLLMMACDSLGIEIQTVMDGKLSNLENETLSLYIANLKTKKLYMTDKPGLRVGEIKAIARMWKKQHSIEILYIDHIHLVYDDVDHSNPEQRFTNVANKLKELAKELEIPILPLAQLARKDLTESKTHDITHLKYAGGIEQAADVILLIFRPEMHGILSDQNGVSTAGFTRIIVGKLRLLPKRDVLCHFTGTRFVDMDEYKNGWTKPTVYSWSGIPQQSRLDNPKAGIVVDYKSLNAWQQERPPFDE